MMLIYSHRENIPFRTIEETLLWSLRMAPYLNDLEEMTVGMYLGGKNKRFDFLWERPCHTLSYEGRTGIDVLRWHLQNNDRLRCVRSQLFSHNFFLDLIPLCAEKRLTWKMTYFLLQSTLQCFKTWQGDTQWMEIYPLTDSIKFYPESGRAFYEDEHVQKEFVWTSDHEAYLTITWK
uniref:DUF3916 domain-containing protein n=1 Tax=Steinernema glaseri TaxID=37863 RepID=A0A1I7YPI7_9BILA